MAGGQVLSCVCTSVETEFLPYVEPLFQRALSILHENVSAEVVCALPCLLP